MFVDAAATNTARVDTKQTAPFLSSGSSYLFTTRRISQRMALWFVSRHARKGRKEGRGGDESAECAVLTAMRRLPVQ